MTSITKIVALGLILALGACQNADRFGTGVGAGGGAGALGGASDPSSNEIRVGSPPPAGIT